MGKKRWISAVSAVLLLALYAVIFLFSAQNGDTSGGISMRVSERCVEFINSISGGQWTETMQHRLAVLFEHPIRKTAHFMEYALMGCLVWGVWRPWRSRLGRIVIPWVFVSAAADEFHQLFVAGRDGNVLDVLLDTAGGCFGLLLCVAAERLAHRCMQKKKAKDKTDKVKSDKLIQKKL